MKSVKIGKVASEYFHSVKNITSVDENAPLLFTFAQFKLKPININNEFNNHYKDINEFSEKMAVLLNQALPLLSNERASVFSKEYNKASNLHLHKVTNKREIIEKILREYGFNETAINNIFEGENVYQLEVPYANGSTRIIFQRIDNLISFLFIDPNHHVYFNKQKVDEAGSLYYEHCPVNTENQCPRMDYLGTCFVFDYLDEEKYRKSYENSYDPQL